MLAGKPDGGERDLSLLAVLVRLHARLRGGPTREWCAARAGWWDTAIAESEPLRVALGRAFRIECYEALGFQTAMTLLDVKKYYASIRL